jgi:hypothetical protein
MPMGSALSITLPKGRRVKSRFGHKPRLREDVQLKLDKNCIISSTYIDHIAKLYVSYTCDTDLLRLIYPGRLLLC